MLIFVTWSNAKVILNKMRSNKLKLIFAPIKVKGFLLPQACCFDVFNLWCPSIVVLFF